MVRRCLRGSGFYLKYRPDSDQFIGDDDNLSGPRHTQQLDGRRPGRLLAGKAENGLAWIRTGRLFLPC